MILKLLKQPQKKHIALEEEFTQHGVVHSKSIKNHFRCFRLITIIFIASSYNVCLKLLQSSHPVKGKLHGEMKASWGRARVGDKLGCEI
jgi:hypothetical protein